MRLRYPTRLIITCLLLATLSWAGQNALAEEFRTAGMHGPAAAVDGPMIRHLVHAIERLDLSEEQRESIHQLMRDGRKDMHAIRAASQENLQAMHEIIRADELDEDSLSRVAQRSGELAEDRVLLAGRHLHAILAELDPSQREQLRALGEEMRERHKHRQWHQEDNA